MAKKSFEEGNHYRPKLILIASAIQPPTDKELLEMEQKDLLGQDKFWIDVRAGARFILD